MKDTKLFNLEIAIGILVLFLLCPIAALTVSVILLAILFFPDRTSDEVQVNHIFLTAIILASIALSTLTN